ncbi:hypothetical protein NADFUDRAFT_65139 [Nadsonia fulvescens var. elongata DSM 6958]|uniref:Ribosomal protein 60S n=1 Tax=Nadsonia fulvescens var. elongata DSM 6958 TaxID=857566 RepID=A0A1E3PMC4_9ASCO|nr:hypothetical protein NADFUDRAFT_65139 [Nadsonia fulvescens var. elongata DSM 6958]
MITFVKYLAAYLLLNAAGNAAPSAADITSVLSAVGIEVEEEKLTLLLKELEGKSIDELVAEGNTKLASVPAGAAEEEVEEAAEESDDDMGFGLFD